MHYHVVPCNTVQYHAMPCNTMQYHAIPYNTMQYHALSCNTLQYHAIPCNTMQYHAIPSNTMQYHACLITADGAYHCPVGSIMAIFLAVWFQLLIWIFLCSCDTMQPWSCAVIFAADKVALWWNGGAIQAHCSVLGCNHIHLLVLMNASQSTASKHTSTHREIHRHKHTHRQKHTNTQAQTLQPHPSSNADERTPQHSF